MRNPPWRKIPIPYKASCTVRVSDSKPPLETSKQGGLGPHRVEFYPQTATPTATSRPSNALLGVVSWLHRRERIAQRLFDYESLLFFSRRVFLFFSRVCHEKQGQGGRRKPGNYPKSGKTTAKKQVNRRKKRRENQEN